MNPQKDFKDYLRKVGQPSVQTYLTNHPRLAAEIFDESGEETKRIVEVDPFMKSAEVIEKQEKKKREKAAAGGDRRRGSKKEKEENKRNSVMAELASNLKRSSSNQSQPDKCIEMVADEYLREHFRLPGGFFTIKSPEEAQLKNQDLTRQLEIVEAMLG